jgi:Rrf2 family protein
MFFSKSCEYALRATMYLAKNNGMDKTGIHTIAKDLDLPLHYLSKVMQTLVKNNIISSVKGRNGGFYLNQNELNEPLMRVVQSIDGEDVFLKCGLGISNCSSKRPCPLHNDIKAYRENLQLALSIPIKSTREGIINSQTFLVR